MLFADVSGFTGMASRLDAELVAAKMNELWSHLDAVIADHGGRVDKHIGDAVMAVWGVASTSEDDPERAVRAGLALQAELRLWSSGDELALRVGINTGPAHLGAVGVSGEFTAMGDTVNVASRVQHVAPLGRVVVTHDTYRHIRGVFDVDALEPAFVKGKEEAIRVYVVRAAKARAFHMPTRGVEGVETRMIGRAAELNVMRSEFERVVAEPVTRHVTVIGEAGIGKSRLLYEFENWIELHPAGVYYFKGRALPTRRSVAFGLLRDVLAARFGVLDSDAAADVAGKLRRGLGPILGPGEAELVGHWLGFNIGPSVAVQRLLGSGQLAAAARAHFFGYIEALGSSEPIVIFLEDLHWADDESLALVDDLVAHLVDVHLLVVGVARPALLERAATDAPLEPTSVVLPLEALGPETTRELVGEVLHRVGRVPDELTDLIVERADGNAFYVEELVKMLIEDGVIETADVEDPWIVHVERLAAERVPATLTGVLQTRIDSLAPAERDTLQRSSVVGRVFWDGAVASLGQDGIEATASSLDEARQRELVLRHSRSSFDDNAEFVFKHALLRDVTYETVLLRDRQRLHGLVADWIAHHSGDRLLEFASLIATHHRMAGDLGAAAELLRRAGVASLESGNAPAARRNLDEAFELWHEAGLTPPASAQLAIAEACLRLGDVDAAHRYREDALRLVVTTEERVAALFLGSWIASERGHYEDEQAMLDDAMPDAERLGGLMLVRVITSRSWCALLRGDTPAAASDAERVHELATDLHHPMASRLAFAALASVAYMTGDLHASLRHSGDALAMAVEAGDLEGQLLAHSNLGIGHHLVGDIDGSRDHYRAALDHYGQARSLGQRLGRPSQVAMTVANMAQAHVRLGDDAAARRLIYEALTTNSRSGGTATRLFCVLAEADRRLVNGDVSEGLELIQLVRRHPSCTTDSQAEIERILGRAGLSVDDAETAVPPSGRAFDDAIDRLLDELASANGAS